MKPGRLLIIWTLFGIGREQLKGCLSKKQPWSEGDSGLAQTQVFRKSRGLSATTLASRTASFRRTLSQNYAYVCHVIIQ